MTSSDPAKVQQRLDEARERFFALERASNESYWWRPIPREKWQAYEELQNNKWAAYAAWMRASAEVNLGEHPDGPDLATWTVDAVRGGTAADWAAFNADIERLRRGDRTALESTVRYLEADVWRIGSGWEKEKILRYIMRSDIARYEDRLRSVVITVVHDQHDRRELYRYALLARRLMGPELPQALEEFASTSGEAANHAKYVLRLASPTSGPIT